MGVHWCVATARRRWPRPLPGRRASRVDHGARRRRVVASRTLRPPGKRGRATLRPPAHRRAKRVCASAYNLVRQRSDLAEILLVKGRRWTGARRPGDRWGLLLKTATALKGHRGSLDSARSRSKLALRTKERSTVQAEAHPATSAPLGSTAGFTLRLVTPAIMHP